MTKEKICNKCLMIQPYSEYYANSKSPDKKTHMCKTCYREYEHRRRTPEFWEKKRQYRKESPEKFMYWRAKKRAIEYNLPFNIELSDIVIPTHCPYLKIELTNIQGKGRQPFNPSLDKIIPELGYVKGNIEIISNKANIMKSNATHLELIEFAKSILERSKNVS